MKKFVFALFSVLVAISMLAACAPAAPATDAPAAPATTAPPASTLAVGIVLPTKDEPRWIQDETRFKDALTAAGYQVEILFSQGDSAKEKANVEALLTKGIKVLIICPQDAAAAGAAVDEARKAGVKVISYDRLVTGSNAVDFYVTFDSVSVGKAQGQYLIDKNTAKGTPLYLYAGAASDNNAFLFFEGAWTVLQPKIADGTFVIKNSSEAIALQAKLTLTRDEQAKIIGQVTTNWDFNTAKNLAEANLTSAAAADKGTVAILAPNDGTARAIADAFGADKDVKAFTVTGQDAEKASVQYIIDGKQSMTVFKDVRTLVKDAIAAAVTFLGGSTPKSTNSYNNGKIDVPAAPSAVVTVDKANVKAALVDSGYYQASDFTMPVASTLAVGIVLPTKDEPRWIQDETRFKDALTAAGYQVEILFSQGDSAKEKANVEALLTKGIQVLIICPQDAAAAGAAAAEARKAGVKVISYDRLITGTDAVDFYVTFDSISVGKAQGQYLVDKNTAKGTPLYLYAGAASDNNAFLFFEGAWTVLQPKIADGTFVIKNSSEAVTLQSKATLTRDEQAKIIGQVTTNWDFNTAKNLAEANLTSAAAADKGTVAILAPNDGTARAIADAFKADKDVKAYTVTGQDAEKASVQYIIDGKQSMTVFKDVRTLVKDAITAAVTFLGGTAPKSTNSYNNGKIDVPAAPSAVVTVDKANVKAALVDSGYYQATDFTGLDSAVVVPAGELAVGIVLPTKDEPRWIQDETRFKDALTAAGYKVEILFSQGDSAKEKANVEALLTKGIKVLIICPQDAAAAGAAVDEARKAGVKVISYDRLVSGSAAVDFDVTIDSISVGKAQAQYLVDKNTTKGTPLYLYAGAASDNNAFLFFEGAWTVLQPKIADGTFVIKNSSEAVALQAKATLTRDEQAKIIGQVTTNWDFNTAKNLAEANLTSAPAADKGVVAILAPNDGTARAIADTFKADKDVKAFTVTGQDAEKASVQYIIDGKQSMTVFKDVRTLVKDAITAAITFLSGKTPTATNSYNNGKIDVPAAPSAVVTVDKANVKAALIDSGYYLAADFTGLP